MPAIPGTGPGPDIPAAAPGERLRALADRYGVVTETWGYDGERRDVSEHTLVAVLAALGVDASSPERVDVALENADADPWRRTLPPVVVVRAGTGSHVAVHVPHGDPAEVWVELDEEAGGGRIGLAQLDVYVPPRVVDGRTVGRATFAVPDDLPLGWHTMVARHGADGQDTASCSLVVTPDRLDPEARLDGGRGWGFMAQLYSVRSQRSWGVGDLADLRDVAWMAARRCGADFMLINPLHAAEPAGPMTPSPYLPASRRFVNPLYIRVEDIPETAYLPVAERTLVEWQAEVARPLSLDPGPIDRDAAWAAKKVALAVVFAAGRSAAREQRFADFCAEQGPGLVDFATWAALCEHFEGQDWPEEARDRGSDLVRDLAEQLDERIRFHCWLQWVADEQLAAAQRAATTAGMRIGIMHDLAVGVHPGGADTWAMPEVLAPHVSVGAPPDMYSQQGQNWSQPPWRPEALARAGYRPFRDMLRTVLRHAGAIRIDHVMGLFRLWWIPEGHDAGDGAYVRYDHEAMIGIVCLEAWRAGAVVIGEDLGVVEPWVRGYLSDRGILGTSVLWFERHDDAPIPPEQYRRLVLATVVTHDLPPAAGYLAGEHVDLRERLGLLTGSAQELRAAERAERGQVLEMLTDHGLVGEDPSEREVIEALHRLLLRSPALLIGVSLVDAVGERRTQNLPGTDQEYPNWKIPLADGGQNLVLVDDLFDNPRLRSLVAALNDD